MGQLLAERLSSAFSSLQASLEEIVGGESRQLLRLAVCSSFGPGWLVPRLPSFVEANPGIDLQLQLFAQDPQLSHQVADAIFSTLPVTPGFSAIHVLDEMLVAVHAPGPQKGRHRLITTELEPQKLGQDWLDYCAQAGLGHETVQQGAWLRSTHFLLALEMARGDGRCTRSRFPCKAPHRGWDAGLSRSHAHTLRPGLPAVFQTVA